MITTLTPCKRCGAPFPAEWCDSLHKPWSCCTTCRVRNIFDGLGMVTPPELLDKHTRRPALTQRQYQKLVDTPLLCETCGCGLDLDDEACGKCGAKCA